MAKCGATSTNEEAPDELDRAFALWSTPNSLHRGWIAGIVLLAIGTVLLVIGLATSPNHALAVGMGILCLCGSVLSGIAGWIHTRRRNNDRESTIDRLLSGYAEDRNAVFDKALARGFPQGFLSEIDDFRAFKNHVINTILPALARGDSMSFMNFYLQLHWERTGRASEWCCIWIAVLMAFAGQKTRLVHRHTHAGLGVTVSDPTWQACGRHGQQVLEEMRASQRNRVPSRVPSRLVRELLRRCAAVEKISEQEAKTHAGFREVGSLSGGRRVVDYQWLLMHLKAADVGSLREYAEELPDSAWLLTV